MTNYDIPPRSLRGTFLKILVAALIAACTALPSTRAGQAGTVDFGDQTAFGAAFGAILSGGDAKWELTSLSTGEPVLEKTGGGCISYILNSAAAADAKGASSAEATATFRIVGSWAVASFGVWLGVDQSNDGGWLALVNLVSPDEVRIRIFGRESNPKMAKLGTPLLDQTLAVKTPLGTGDFFRLRFLAREQNGKTVLAASLLPEFSDDALAEASVEDPGGETPAGSAGVRCAGERVLWKNFRFALP